MPPKGKQRRRKAAPANKSHQVKVAVSALFLLGFLIVCLILLAEWRESYRQSSSAPPIAPPSATRDAPTFEQLRSRLEDALLRSGIAIVRLPIVAGEEPVRHEVAAVFPNNEALGRLDGFLSAVSPRLAVKSNLEDAELAISWDGSPRYLLRFNPPEPAGRTLLAIIMDDLGRDVGTARKLLQIDMPVTLSILPNTAQASQVATIAHRQGREVMIHLPMEPHNYPENNPGHDALFLKLSPQEIRHQVTGYLERIPYAVGGNNHMGSRFTESRLAMISVLEVMKEENLFFVDSLTSGQSVAYLEARRMGIPAAKRDLFLDNDQEVEQIDRQIHLLVELALRQGQAIGICHPYPETLEALRRAVPYLKRNNVSVVPASRLLDR